ncbi:MAG: hypothetical protein EOL97_10020 [Spirochaetia bacterium]|nr:hypothetical protein [Spirochaetia bacterium]
MSYVNSFVIIGGYIWDEDEQLLKELFEQIYRERFENNDFSFGELFRECTESIGNKGCQISTYNIGVGWECYDKFIELITNVKFSEKSMSRFTIYFQNEHDDYPKIVGHRTYNKFEIEK